MANTNKIPTPSEAIQSASKATNAAGANPVSSVEASLGSGDFNLGATLQNAKNSITSSISASAANFSASIRKTLGLPAGGEPQKPAEGNEATWADKASIDVDWRVRLSIAPGYKRLFTNPLQKSDDNLIFPLTPTIMINHSASYTPIKPIHSNYPFYAYQNSALENITITGEFPVENEEDGKYWIAATHYLRAVSKMAYGNTENVGSPPPVIKLNGYGDYVFKDVPVVVTNFNYELANDIDYIRVEGIQGGKEGTYVPTRSTISVTLIPMYSRRQVKKFSLQAFIAGRYVSGPMKGML